MPPGEPVGATLVGTNHGETGSVKKARKTTSTPPTSSTPGSDNITAQAMADATSVFSELSALPATPTVAALAGVTLYPGVYSSATFTLASGVLTFDALNDTNATFVMISPGYLLVSSPYSMVLMNGALASRIFWALGDYASLAT